MQDLKAELAETLDEAEWQWLMPHAQRDRLIVVSLGLDLVDVGVAIANDDVLSVQHWIGEQLIYKPSPTQMASWQSDGSKRFNALIVQPYVLVQEPSVQS
ncbi:DUF2288 domain-containing protein [Planktothrix sp. FACHB-1355]|uniref:DUF2288 domain-containing protein n=1 Tax=Aerosakkonema funiforme FACHB-1375 TaxID=2949571 RepID=A0A926ZJE4_9CYAN|nr:MULTISPECIES: DUF2288 domain-containing protein [Oscillatoriales]MBD2182826.1 DUF2288 domain-containing protein [Aerosakkonema funiforme FACHB-1375]MBD3560975.1 DUF2288 domain-containing protein [Planktothrix sp. FACHB-1355]